MHSNLHHHHHRTTSSRIRRQRLVILLVISSSSLFIILRLIIKSDRNTGNINQHHDRSAILPGEETSLRSSLSLHRWYTSSMNRYRNYQNDHVPIHSILFRTYQKQKLQRSKSRTVKPPLPPQHRIAMLLPYTTTPSSSNHDNSYTSILSYFTLFCYSVAGTADIMDFYIFHTGILRDDRNRDDDGDDEHDALRNHTTLQHCPPNVIFVNLKNHRVLAQYLLRVVDAKYQTGNHSDPTLPPPKRPVMKYSELSDLVESYVKMNPYGLVEFKPALGHVFADYIRPNMDETATAYYTHWGYTDFDIAFGDVARWLTAEELSDYDIVTYTFGDQQRLYVRGQFTIHKNQPETINQLWRQCSYLSNLDERFESIIQHSTKYHVESAEGCYSAVLLNQTNISIKFAVKAWTDIYTDDTAYTHGVAISQSPITGRQVLYKLKAGGGMNEHTPTNSSNLFYSLRSSWFENEDSVYFDRSVDLQRPVGERIRLDDPYDKDNGTSKTKKKPCMYWALAKYQSKLCLKDGIVNSNDIVYFINGVLYKQQYENVPIFPNEPNIITAPLFHFQEWKRSYRFEQLAPLYSSLLPPSSSMFNANTDVNTFILTPNGVIPMISSSYRSFATKKVKKKPSMSSAVSSPLGKTDLTTWSSEMHLPLSTYCIRSRLDASKLHTKCDTAISYHDDTGRLTILSRAPQWTHVSIESDVSLVLTLQFMPSWDVETKEHLVQGVIDNVKMNIDRWYGRPCILVISLPNRLYEKTNEYLRRHLEVETNPNVGSCFIMTLSDDQIQENNDADAISRKALLNMAIDMVPTRWYVSGIELERGLVVSTDTSYVAHRTAATYSALRGNIFIVPQFGSIHTTTEEDIDNQNADADESNFSFDEFLRLKRSGNVSSLGDEWTSDCTDHEELLNELKKRIDNVWMAESLLLIGSITSDVDPSEVNLKIIRDLETFQQYMVKMAQEGMDEAYEDTAMYAYHESPILLTDNLSPHDGIRTSEIVREVEAFAGIRCYNIVRLSQMILMNYTVNVLPLAFVSKSPYAKAMTNEMQEQQNEQRHCPAMCTNFLVDDEEILYEIARSEIQRAAMTGVVWAETLGIKPSLIFDVE